MCDPSSAPEARQQGKAHRAFPYPRKIAFDPINFMIFKCLTERLLDHLISTRRAWNTLPPLTGLNEASLARSYHLGIVRVLRDCAPRRDRPEATLTLAVRRLPRCDGHHQMLLPQGNAPHARGSHFESASSEPPSSRLLRRSARQSFSANSARVTSSISLSPAASTLGNFRSSPSSASIKTCATTSRAYGL